jgi:peroxiredoxin
MAEVKVGRRAPEVTLLRTDGSEASLAELAGGAPLVLFFLRHYG